MKSSISCILILAIAACFPAVALAQNKRLVVLSPHIGTVIDSLEAAMNNFFQTMLHFHSASIYQAADSSVWAAVRWTTEDGALRDSTLSLSFGLLYSYVARIRHWEELMKGEYRLSAAHQSHALLEEQGRKQNCNRKPIVRH